MATLERVIKRYISDGCYCNCHTDEGQLCEPPFCCKRHWRLVKEKWIEEHLEDAKDLYRGSE